jgi:hypothetical protein
MRSPVFLAVLSQAGRARLLVFCHYSTGTAANPLNTLITITYKFYLFISSLLNDASNSLRGSVVVKALFCKPKATPDEVNEFFKFA